MSSSLKPGGAALGAGFETLRRTNFETLLNRIGTFKPLRDVSALEVGCGRGWFLEAARARGMVSSGVEPGPDGAIPRNNGFTIYEGFFPEALPTGATFDLIIFNDVFEHIPNPVRAIKAVQEHLTPDGLAVINLPSSDGVFFKFGRALNMLGITGPYERLWQKGLPSPHMSYFNADNLRSLIARHTDLRELDRFTLPALSQDGLRERIKITNPGLVGELMFVALSLSIPILQGLQSDIAVVTFQRGQPVEYLPKPATDFAMSNDPAEQAIELRAALRDVLSLVRPRRSSSKLSPSPRQEARNLLQQMEEEERIIEHAVAMSRNA